VIALLLLVIFLCFLIGLTILKSNNLSPELFSIAQNIPHHDKVGHFVLMAILAYLASAAIVPWLKNKKFKHPELIIVTLLIILITLEESSQYYFPSRSCSWLDAAAGIIGVLTTTSLYKLYLLKKLKTSI